MKYKHLIYCHCLCVLSTRNILKWFVSLLIGKMQIYRQVWRILFVFMLLGFYFSMSGFESEYGSLYAPVTLTGSIVSLSSKSTKQGPPLSGKLLDFSVLRGKLTIHMMTLEQGLFPLTHDQEPFRNYCLLPS